MQFIDFPTFDFPIPLEQCTRWLSLLRDERFVMFESEFEEASLGHQLCFFDAAENALETETVLRYAGHLPRSYIAHAIATAALVDHAWQVRGSGWAKDTPIERLEEHARILEGALEYAYTSYRLKPNAHAAKSMMQIFMATTSDLEMPFEVLRDCLTHVPDAVNAVYAYCMLIEPRWSGLERHEWLEAHVYAIEELEHLCPLIRSTNSFVRALRAQSDESERAVYYDNPGILEDFDVLMNPLQQVDRIVHIGALNQISYDLYKAGWLELAEEALHAAGNLALMNPWFPKKWTAWGVRRAVKVRWWQFWRSKGRKRS